MFPSFSCVLALSPNRSGPSSVISRTRLIESTDAQKACSTAASQSPPRYCRPVHVDRLELDTVRELVDLRGKRVLELGCGDGRFTFLYAEDAAYVLGIDPKRVEIREARRTRAAPLTRRIKFRVADTISPPRRPFDVALFSWSL